MYLAIPLLAASGILAVWTYLQYLCCDMSYFWSNFWLVLGVLCGGWIAGIMTLSKQGRI